VAGDPDRHVDDQVDAADRLGRQAALLADLMRHPLKTARAYRWTLRFEAVYVIGDPNQAADYLSRFTRGARHSRLAPIIRFAQMVDEYLLTGGGQAPLPASPRRGL
jgi:hypothetical protein